LIGNSRYQVDGDDATGEGGDLDLVGEVDAGLGLLAVLVLAAPFVLVLALAVFLLALLALRVLARAPLRVFLGATLVVTDAEAARVGGGRTVGAQRSITNTPPSQTPAKPAQQTQQTAPSQQPAAQPGAAPAAGQPAAASGLSRWMPMLGGLAIGALIGPEGSKPIAPLFTDQERQVARTRLLDFGMAERDLPG